MTVLSEPCKHVLAYEKREDPPSLIYQIYMAVWAFNSPLCPFLLSESNAARPRDPQSDPDYFWDDS